MGEGAVLTPCAAAGIGEAFGRLLVQKTGGAQPSVAVGHDPRESGPALAQAVADGLPCRLPALFDGTVHHALHVSGLRRP